MLNQGYAQYQQTAVQTAAPEKLLLMLFDGGIKFAQQAVVAIENKNVQDANKYLLKTQDIILEFMSTLDMQYEVASNLMSLYEYMNRRLIEANTKKDAEPVKEVLGYLTELRETFEEAAQKLKRESAAVGKGINCAG